LDRLTDIAAGAAEQAAQFEELAGIVTDAMANGTVVVMGDFNAEPDWPLFRSFLDHTKLVTGATPPATRRLGGAGFAIDHVLTGPGATLTGLTTGLHAGSDHLPLVATVKAEPADRSGDQ
jgi:endonuclease/exonuclease/phosphatase (EEP) superfamily protein YafD